MIDMPQNQTTSGKFDQYLAQIESRERNKRRRYQIAGILGAIVLVGCIGFWFIREDQPLELRQFQANSLDYTTVKNLFETKPGEIVVAHPAIGVDTIYSPEDYLSLRGLLDQLEAKSIQSSEPMEVEVPPTFAVDIAGSREVGSTLVFSIENYDESLTYLIDFGNGYRREVNQRMTYTYRSPGNYRLRLIATNDQGSSSIYNKSIRIDRGKQPESRNSNESVIADTRQEPMQAEESEDSIPGSRADISAPLSAMRGPSIQATPIESDIPKLRERIPEIEEESSTSSSLPSLKEPLIASDIPPSYRGGMDAMGSFIRSNYRYPRAAQNANIEGKVYIQFVVHADGTISGAKVLKGIGGGCDEEALRLVSMMPKWIPGKQAGAPVATYHTVPITFKLLR